MFIHISSTAIQQDRFGVTYTAGQVLCHVSVLPDIQWKWLITRYFSSSEMQLLLSLFPQRYCLNKLMCKMFNITQKQDYSAYHLYTRNAGHTQTKNTLEYTLRLSICSKNWFRLHINHQLATWNPLDHTLTQSICNKKWLKLHINTNNLQEIVPLFNSYFFL